MSVVLPDQLNTLPPEQAALLIRKKRFWKRTMWISLSATILLAILGFSGTIIGVLSAFGSMEETGVADPAALAGGISKTLMLGVIVFPLVALAFLLFLIALIRGLSLPKIPKA